MAELRTKRECIYVERPPFPKNMLMELTNACNHACIFCANRKQTRKISNCDKELFMRIIQEAYENGTREIGFYMSGEPFICRDLEEYVKKAGDIYGNGLERMEYIYITTNGALANIERVKKLVHYGLSSIKFSLNAATREVYQKIHGKDDFDIVKKNIEDLYHAKQSGLVDIPVFISFIVNKFNFMQKELMQQVFGKYVDKIYFYDVVNQGGGTMYDNSEIMVSDAKQAATLPCEMVFNCLHVNSDGYLTACCTDFDNLLAVADLHDVSLLDAWYDERLIQLRKQHITSKLSNNACYNCYYNTMIDNLEPLNPNLLTY